MRTGAGEGGGGLILRLTFLKELPLQYTLKVNISKFYLKVSGLVDTYPDIFEKGDLFTPFAPPVHT